MNIKTINQVLFLAMSSLIVGCQSSNQVGSNPNTPSDVHTSMLSGANTETNQGFTGSMANVAISPLDGENFSMENGSVSYNFTIFNADNLGLLPTKLTIGYNSSTKIWDMSMPKVDISSSPKVLNNSGAQYIIDATSPTGLKYMTDKTAHFDSWAGKPLNNVCSSYSGNYDYFYSYTTPDSKLYFDKNGFLMASGDKHGNCNFYSYDINGRLEQYTDVFGHKFSFNILTDGITVTSASGTLAKIHYLNGKKIDSITDSLGRVVSFSYTNGLLSSIKYPSGVTTSITYKNLPYTEDAVLKYTPVVGSVKHVSSSGGILNSSDYYYGENTSNRNFMGYGTYGLSHIADNMMEQNNSSYQYDVKVINHGADGDRVNQTYFNFLHLPVRQITSNSGGRYETISKYDTDYGYSKIRKPYYSKPISVLTTLGDRTVKAINTTYDNDYGVVLSSKEYTYGVEKTSTENTQDSKFPWLLKSSIVTEKISGATQNSTMSYDDKANLVNSTKSKNGQTITTSYSYLANGLPSSQTTSDGSTTATTKFTYDISADTMSITTNDTANRSSTNSFSTTKMFNPLLSSTDGNGNTDTYTADMLGRTTSHTDALGNTTHYTYTPTANTMKLPSGYIVTEKLDELNRVTSVMDNKNGGRTLASKVFNSFGEVTSETDGLLNLTTTYGYDAWGRMVKSTSPTGDVTTTEYDDHTDTITTYLNGVKTTVTKVDPDGNTLEQTSYSRSSGSKGVKNVYNGFGEVISTSDYLDGSLFGTSTYSYDINGKPLTSEFTGNDGSKSKTSASYNMYGNVLSSTTDITSQGKSGSHKSVINTYSAGGDLISSTDQLGRTTTYAYDKNGQVTQINGGDGSVTKNTYDALGRVVSQTTSNMYGSSSISNNYDNSGNLVSKTINGKTYKYNYDSLQTQLNSISNPDGRTYSYTYNHADQMTSSSGNGMDKSYSYDSLGNVTSVTNSGHTVTLSYGKANGLNNQLLSKTLKNANKQIYRTVYSYDGWMKPSKIATTYDNSSLTVDNVFNSLGKLVSNTTTTAESVININYKYDSLGRLLEANNSSTGVEKYTYDANNNVVGYTDGNNVSHSLSYNPIDQLVKYDKHNISYDELGNSFNSLTGNKYKYDKNNNLIEVDGESFIAQYTYTADNMLATRSVRDKASNLQGKEYKFNYSPDDTLDKLQDGETLYKVLSGNDGFIPNSTSLQSVYLIPNNTKVAQFITESQTLSGLLNYSAYGLNMFTNKPGDGTQENDLVQSFGFNKQQYTDESTGLIYANARWYDPSRMSFINQDSYELANRYNYVNGDPINYADPTGHFAMPNWANYAIGGAGVALSGAITVATFGAAAPAGVALGVASTAAFAGGLGVQIAADNVTDEHTKQVLNYTSLGLNAVGMVTGIGAMVVPSKGAMVLNQFEKMEQFQINAYNKQLAAARALEGAEQEQAYINIVKELQASPQGTITFNASAEEVEKTAFQNAQIKKIFKFGISKENNAILAYDEAGKPFLEGVRGGAKGTTTMKIGSQPETYWMEACVNGSITATRQDPKFAGYFANLKAQINNGANYSTDKFWGDIGFKLAENRTISPTTIRAYGTLPLTTEPTTGDNVLKGMLALYPKF